MGRVEGSPLGLQNSAPDVHVEGRIPGTNEDPFPKVVGRTRFFAISTADGVALVDKAPKSQRLDKVDVRSATAMSGGE